MINNPDCPICGTNDWLPLAKRQYCRDDAAKASPYVAKRLEVLFQIWCTYSPEVELTSILCRRCGFVCYSPRPDENDISAKYRFLASDASTSHEIAMAISSDEERSSKLLHLLDPYLHDQSNILDFGGGNGRLMSSFLAKGFSCDLVDFPGDKIPGIRYLGSDLIDIPTGSTYDIIVVSHVLEHLADPYKPMRELVKYLTNNGTMYVEVPLEIWGRAPLPAEPVTHINYFTTGSMRTLLERSGYSVIECSEGSYTTEMGTTGLAIRAYARRAETISNEMDYADGPKATLELINPGLLKKAGRILKYPDIFARSVKHGIIRRIAKKPVLWRLLKKRNRLNE